MNVLIYHCIYIDNDLFPLWLRQWACQDFTFTTTTATNTRNFSQHSRSIWSSAATQHESFKSIDGDDVYWVNDDNIGLQGAAYSNLTAPFRPMHSDNKVQQCFITF